MRNIVVVEGRPLAAARAPSVPAVRRHEGCRLMYPTKATAPTAAPAAM
jgi:hypothetical protein